MSIDMAMFAMMGSLVGASATVATAWFTQKTLSRREFTRVRLSASPAVLAEAERQGAPRGDVKAVPDETLTLR